jgi:hypothetical protein
VAFLVLTLAGTQYSSLQLLSATVVGGDIDAS